MRNTAGRFLLSTVAILTCAAEAWAQVEDSRLSWTASGEGGILSYRVCPASRRDTSAPQPLCYGNFDRQRLGLAVSSSRFAVDVVAERTNVGSVASLPMIDSNAESIGSDPRPWVSFRSVHQVTRLRTVFTSRLSDRFAAAFAVAGGTRFGGDSFAAATRLGFSDRREFGPLSSGVGVSGEQVMARGAVSRGLVLTSVVGILNDRLRVRNTLATPGEASSSPFSAEHSIATQPASVWREASVSVDLPDRLLQGPKIREAVVTIAAHNVGFTREPLILALGIQLGFR